MDKNKMLLELETVKKELSKLNEKIADIENKLNSITDETNDFNNYEIAQNNLMLNKFQNYLETVKHLKRGSIKNYLGELKKIRIKFLEFLNIEIPYEIYQIDNLEYLNKLLIKFKENGDFIELNKKAHNSLSAAFNNYIAFLEYNRTDFVIDED